MSMITNMDIFRYMKDKHDIKYIDINQLYDVSKLPYIDDSKYDFKIVTCI